MILGVISIYFGMDNNLDNLEGTGWNYCSSATVPVEGRREGWILQLQAPNSRAGTQNTRVQYFFEYDGSTVWRRIRVWDSLAWTGWKQI